MTLAFFLMASFLRSVTFSTSTTSLLIWSARFRWSLACSSASDKTLDQAASSVLFDRAC